MKKLILIFFLVLVNTTPLFATNFLTTLTTPTSNIEPGQEFVVNFTVSNATRLETLEGALQFDTSKISLVQSEYVFNGHNIAIGSRLVVRFNAVRSGSFVAAQVRFRARTGFNIGDSTTITFSGIMGSDGTTDFTSPNANTTLTMVAPRSDNNYLASLSLSTGELAFARARTSYSIDVDNNVTSITIGATLEDNNATITGLGTFPLQIYENEFVLVIRAENGSRRSVSITIRRRDEQGNPSFRSNSTDLTSLKVSACYLDFVNTIDAYRCDVRNDVNTTSLFIVASEPTQQIQAPNQVNLQEGENIIDIEVRAANDDIRRITITINRRTDVFFVPVQDAMRTLTQISTLILGVQLDDTARVPATLLNEALRLGKRLVVTYRDATILLTPLSQTENDVIIPFRHATAEDLSRFNYARGQFVGLTAPLPTFVAGSWWIHPSLHGYDLYVYAIDDPSMPLDSVDVNASLEVEDLTQALFITPAVPSSPPTIMLLLPALTALIGLLAGVLTMGLIMKRRNGIHMKKRR